MPRPELPEIPKHAHYRRFRVDPADVDALGHVNNVRWVQWINDAASAHSTSVGLGLEGYQKLGYVWIVRRHEVDYMVEAKEHEELESITWIDSVRGATCTRRTLIRRTQDQCILASATTRWALISLATRRPIRVPPELPARYGFVG